MNAQISCASPHSCHCWKSNGGQQQLKVCVGCPPPTTLPEAVPGASREKHEVWQLDFWHLRGMATREHVSSGVWHRVGRFLVDIYLQLRSLLGATWINAYTMSYIKCLTEFGWTRWVLVHSEWFIAYNSFSESCMIETFCFSECLREEAWSMTASWGWSSRKQRCAGTSSSCFKKLLKKTTTKHAFLFQVIPTWGDGRFFWSLGWEL